MSILNKHIEFVNEQFKAGETLVPETFSLGLIPFRKRVRRPDSIARFRVRTPTPLRPPNARGEPLPHCRPYGLLGMGREARHQWA